MSKSVALALVSLSLLLTAQTPAPKPPAGNSSQSTPTIKVTTRLVEVNVVVHGRKNEPVDDLS